MIDFSSTIIEFNLLNKSFREISLKELDIAHSNPELLYWIHCDLKQTENFNKVASKLKLPDELIALCQNEDMMPKVIDSNDALIIQIQCLATTELNKKNIPYFANLIIYLTNKFCFTASDKPIDAVLEFTHSFQKAMHYAKTPCFIVFLILDDVVNDYAKVLFTFELLAEEMDLHLYKVQQQGYRRVINLKHQVMQLKRYMISLREILMRISGRNIEVISNQCRHSLSNLSNHVHMVVHESDSIRDILNGLLDQIDNALMQKLNETMRVLTAFAAIFLPLTLITGIYGMNFHWMPELNWKYGYFFALGLIACCACILLYIFKRMKWF